MLRLSVNSKMITSQSMNFSAAHGRRLSVVGEIDLAPGVHLVALDIYCDAKLAGAASSVLFTVRNRGLEAQDLFVNSGVLRAC